MVKFLLSFLFISSLAFAQSLPPEVCASLEEERANNPADFAPLCANSNDPNCPLGYILNDVAWKYREDRWDLSSKDFGYFVYSPAGPIASDILQRDNQMWDVFVAAGTTASVVCNQFVGAATRPSVEPVDDGNNPPPINCEELEKENKLLKIQINNLQVELEQCKTSLEECQSSKLHCVEAFFRTAIQTGEHDR